MNWKLLVAKKAIMARVPFADRLRRWKRRTVGYRPDASNLETTLANYAQIKSAAQAAGVDFAGARILEIGSGWFPVIPILLCLDGAREVIMTDLNRHMDEVTFREAVSFLRERFPERRELAPGQGMAQFPVRYMAPFDASKVEDQCLDLIVSRTVLEHIPPPDIEWLFSVLRRKLRQEGRMVHLIDHSDHLQHQDRSISRIQFLTWSSRFHQWINWLIQEGENRLRHHEYRPVFERAGFVISAETAQPDENTLRRCPSLRLVPPYDKMTPEELSVMTSIYVVQPAHGNLSS